MFGIAIGACCGAFMMAALAVVFGEQLQHLKDSGLLGWAGGIVVLLAFFWLYRRSKKVSV